jgi:dipeptidyl aminopeptidase/acylaminoacyl peptidase
VENSGEITSRELPRVFHRSRYDPLVWSSLSLVLLIPRQAPPATDIYLAPLTSPAPGAPKVINISNSPGYDNQPSFLPDGSAILFASQRGEGKQTDIYRYEIASGAVTRLTNTPESEYSPLVTPDGKTFSVIRQGTDNSQFLWRYDLAGGNGRLALANVNPVGYHVWVDDTHLLLFVLGGQGKPNTLQYADTATGTAEVVDSGIGRSLLRRPGTSTFSYVGKPANGRWVIKSFDPTSRALAMITETVDQNASEDCAWLPDGRLLMASGSTIMAWSSGSGWVEFADFSASGTGRITRLAVSKTHLAFVR